MIKFIFILLFISFPLHLSAQSFPTQKINVNSFDTAYCKVVHLSGENLLLFLTQNKSLMLLRSSDNGKSWKMSSTILPSVEANHWDVIKKENELYLVYKSINLVNILRSTDFGTSWSEYSSFNLSSSIQFLRVTKFINNTYGIYYFSSNKMFMSYSLSGLSGWSAPVQVFSTTSLNVFGSVGQMNNGRYFAVYTRGTSQKDIYITYSDNGTSWSTPTPLLNSLEIEDKPIIVDDASDKKRIYFIKSFPTTITNFKQFDICYIQTTDNGATWSSPIKVTTHVSNDILLSYFKIQNDDYVLFTTDRYKGYGEIDLAYKKVTDGIESETVPYFYNVLWEYVGNSSAIKFKAYFLETSSPLRVFIKTYNGELELFDNGVSPDITANDNIYTNQISLSSLAFENHIGVNSIFTHISNFGIPVQSKNDLTVEIKAIVNNQNQFTFKRNIYFSLDGMFEDVNFLFSGGFMLSGYHNNFIWANGNFGGIRLQDYQFGKFGSSPSDPKNKVYKIRKTDPLFGSSWQEWKNAVELGAYFYDGDNDGKYNPIDKNENGKWDFNEDMPDLIGDVTIFTTINDGVPASERFYSDVNPLGIEIRSTIFASNQNNYLKNTVFARYSILNTGAVASVLDSVIFSFITDHDLGYYGDDLGGCDTTLSAAFTYHIHPDQNFGENIPAAFQIIIQKPWYYTGNPNDTAYNYLGKHIGLRKLVGYKHAKLNSYFRAYACMSDTNGTPRNRIAARRFMLGRLGTGAYANPCSYLGIVRGPVNCNQINPMFHYSGDPVTQTGWLDTTKRDIQSYLNVGPFKLEAGKPVDIIVAHVVAKPENQIHPITNGRNLIQNIYNEYYSNFQTITSIDRNWIANPPTTFIVTQNYPNPFNSTTKIRYSIPEKGSVKIDLYDILGRKISNLLNEEKEIGDYLYFFDASRFGLSSGIYFYEVRYKDYQSVKKMVYVK
ncbi:MAG: T9SS type A sorting domain-containing protein [Ignavibacteria bacterium]|nr:T9SS type A sorting domain-containing protein [Ignavibacteria bacterium]